MDIQKYAEIISQEISTEEELVKHFTEKIAYFIIENDFGDGPCLDDLLREMLDISKTLKQ